MRHRFQAELRPGRGGGAYVVLPAMVSSAVGIRKGFRVRGTVNGFEFRSSTMPDGAGSHGLGVHKATRLAIGASFGDMLEFEIELDDQDSARS